MKTNKCLLRLLISIACFAAFAAKLTAATYSYSTSVSPTKALYNSGDVVTVTVTRVPNAILGGPLKIQQVQPTSGSWIYGSGYSVSYSLTLQNTGTSNTTYAWNWFDTASEAQGSGSSFSGGFSITVAPAAPQTYPLSITITGSGTVTVQNVGSYTSSTTVNVAAGNYTVSESPATGQKLTAWGGAMSGTPNTTSSGTVTVSSPGTSVSAQFDPQATAETISIPDRSVTYDGTAKYLTVQPSPTDAKYTYTGSGYSGTNWTSGSATGRQDISGPSAVGTYTLTATPSGIDPNTGGSYTGSSASGTLTITAKPVTFTFGNLSNQYNGGTFSATVTPSDPSATYTSSLSYGPGPGNYTVTATASGNYSGSGSATASVTSAPPSVSGSISVSPTTGTDPGSTTVSWSTSNATSVSVSGQGVSSTASSGSTTVSGLAAGTYTYTLTAQGNGGPITRTATFTVSAAAPSVSGSISVSPTTATAPGSTTVSWSTSNATSVSVSGQGVSSTASSGSTTVSGLAAGTYTYTLTAQGTGGPITKTATFTVSSSSALDGSITLSPSTGVEPASTTVTWTTSNATTVSFGGAGVSSTGKSGTITRTNYPAGNYTFTLDAYAADGTHIQKTATWVVSPNVSGTISASPSQTTAPGNSTITWTTANSNSTSVTGQGVTSYAANGNATVTGLASGSYGYTLTATSSLGSTITQLAFVDVSPVDGTVDGTISVNPNSSSSSPASTTVTWGTVNATSATVSGSGMTTSTLLHGQTTVTGITSGYRKFTLTAQGFGGPITRTAVFYKSPSGSGRNLSVNASPSSFTWAGGATTLIGDSNMDGDGFALVFNDSTGDLLDAFSVSTPSGTGKSWGSWTAPVNLTTSTISYRIMVYDTDSYGGYCGTYVSVGAAPSATAQTIAISPTSLTVTPGQAQQVTFTASGGHTSYTWSGTDSYNSGTLTIPATATAGTTYTVKVICRAGAVSGTNYAKSNIATATVTASYIPATFTFSGTNQTYDGSAKSVTVTPSPSGATYTLTYTGTGGTSYGTSTTPPTNAGTYTVTATANGSYSGTSSTTLTVARATPAITWTPPASISYGTALSGTQLNATANVPGTFVYSPAAGAVLGAGTTTLTAAFTPTDTANYASANASVSLPVTKASLTVTATDQAKTYGAANPALSYTMSGFVNGDTLAVVSGSAAVTTTATTTSGVGTYAITPSIGTLTAANYSFSSFVNGTLTVNKALLTATADNQARTYGTYNPTLTISYSGFVNGDTASAITAPIAATTATPASSVGTYPITLSGGSAANYALTLRVGALLVTSAQLQVVADDQSRYFADPNPTLTYRVSGFVNGDTAAVLAGAPAVATVADSASPVGTYPITVSQGPLSAANYAFTFTPGTLTVTGHPVTFALSDLAYTYDGTRKSPTVTPSVAGATYSVTHDVGPDAGSYAIVVNATGGWIGSASGTLVISPATQAITLTPGTATLFAGQPVTLTASGGQTTYGWTGATPDAAGTATATVSFPTPGNYTVNVVANADRNHLVSNTATATIAVASNHAITAFTPLASDYTVNDPQSPANGQTYRRIWQDGGWVAYLGRSGVRFQVQAQAWPAVQSLEIQAKPPGGDWTQLATNSPGTNATAADVTFSVMLGATSADQPLVPASFASGAPQTGTWSFRARVQDSNGGWSAFSEEIPVNVILPLVTKTVTGQTVPPAGPLGDWFTASPEHDFPLQLWVP